MSDWTREERLLLDCVHREPSAAVRARILDAADLVDWHRVVHLAETHGVWALLLDKVQRLELEAPATLRRRLEERLIATTARNLACTAQLAGVLASLSAEGIAAVAFKGPSLTARTEDGVGGRSSIDLDILVSPEAAGQVRAVMLAQGYSLVDCGPDGLDGIYPPGRRQDLFRPSRGDLAPVEAQVTVATWPLAAHLDTEGLIARATNVDVAGVPIATLSAEDLLLALAIHGTRDLWGRVRLIADIDAAVRTEPEWSWVVERAAEARIARMLSVALLLAHEILDAPVANAVLELAARDRPAVRLTRQLAGRLFRAGTDAPSALWEWRIWTRSREHFVDRLRCGVRLVLWKQVIWRWDRRRQRDRPEPASLIRDEGRCSRTPFKPT
jgi:hypothetical protein